MDRPYTPSRSHSEATSSTEQQYGVPPATSEGSATPYPIPSIDPSLLSSPDLASPTCYEYTVTRIIGDYTAIGPETTLVRTKTVTITTLTTEAYSTRAGGDYGYPTYRHCNPKIDAECRRQWETLSPRVINQEEPADVEYKGNVVDGAVTHSHALGCHASSPTAIVYILIVGLVTLIL